MHHLQRRVQATQGITPHPVALQRDRLATLRSHRIRGANVQYAVDGLALARIDDRDALPVFTQQSARVTRLTAAQRIKDRAIELDAALAYCRNASRCLLEVSILAEQ